MFSRMSDSLKLAASPRVDRRSAAPTRTSSRDTNSWLGCGMCSSKMALAICGEGGWVG
jgi:hypothetical protein